MDKLILRKQTDSDDNGKKSIFIDADVHKQIKKIKDETGVQMNEIVDVFLRYGINNVVIKDEEEK